ncbi:MAG: nuclear transport factor 2 family protein [Proteobacteria bacterium]|nr:nuclear transport factor 2 family protein [Pseudomonadota bacterium]
MVQHGIFSGAGGGGPYSEDGVRKVVVATAWAAFCALGAVSSAGAGCIEGFVPRSEEEAQIIAVEEAWCESAVQRDASRLDQIFADDVSWIEESGYLDKAAVLARYLTSVQEHGWRQTDVRVRVLGDVAVVQSHIIVDKTVEGRREVSAHTSVDVFQRRLGRWQLIVE